MLNILVFGQSFLGKIGGVQQSYAWLYDFLCRRGHKITHVTHLPVGEFGLHYQFPPEVELKSVNLLFGHEEDKKIRALVSETDPDVVLVINSEVRAMQFCMALYKTPYPVVLSERGSPEYCITELWRSRRLHELAIARADFMHMLMPSYPLALPPHLRERTRVISSLTMPANLRAFPEKANKNGEYVILYTGRFSTEKRVPLLVWAFADLSEKFPQWRLCLVGDGPEKGAIVNAIEAAGIKEKVDLPGYAANPEILCAHYADSHVFCLPSSYEGCPLALREAMAHALPVTGFASCPGTNEIIMDGANGLLASEDTAQSLASSLGKLMSDPDLRAKMGNKGREDVKKYAPEKIHAAWEELLYEAASWKGRKKTLRLERFLKNPVKTFFDAFQSVPPVKRYVPDVFATSPLAWWNEVRGNLLDFSMLNYFHEHGLAPYAPPEAIMKYRSKNIHCLNNSACGGFSAGTIAKNAAAQAIRHGIMLKHLYD